MTETATAMVMTTATDMITTQATTAFGMTARTSVQTDITAECIITAQAANGYGNGVYNYGNNNAAGYNGGVSGTLYGDDSGYSAYRSDTNAERSEL